jgi:pilus assembly protein Flp/PilA
MLNDFNFAARLERYGLAMISKGPKARLRGSRSDSYVWIKELPMNKLIKRFAADESGATAIEYGLIAAGIAVAIIAAVQALGTAISGTFRDVATALNAV